MSRISLEDLAEIEAGFASEDIVDDATTTGIAWHSASRTHVGRVRHINEDAFLDAPERRLWVVADGMGGLNRGDFASKAVVREFGNFTRGHTVADCLRDIEARMAAVNDTCRTAFRGKRSGSTVAAMLVFGDHAFFLWAGDSRIYRWRGHTVEQVTEDHTVAQEKHARGELTPEERDTHASVNVLTRAVGAHRQLKLDVCYHRVEPGDRYLLCSDGLYRHMALPEVASLLHRGTPLQVAENLIDLALDRGGHDNITAIVVEAGDSQAG
ncbi:serine/threonine-protein phosphatase [Mangrovimicrobium sediminis]|uniref:Serine/threonine-protein phosphatase n=1 Tax=Mangrovimicrobium sediminis TaxID=2562682 RepID=A0A4Z0M026_9GAMM|nr:protein phosphatase 2C domain-containing protein [Haliea sp. SAOS-164]TGD72645.1 serine/threonine-protein phosphatase [Haliea sp. SAOS-164]